MKEHVLKTEAPYWDAVDSGDKTFEVRRDDRGYQKGDMLVLQRWENGRPTFEGVNIGAPIKTIRRKVTWILTGGRFGVEAGFVVMGLEK